MSFDRYFEEGRLRDDESIDDWYDLVREALWTADLQSQRSRATLAMNLMKPLPMIPEDCAQDFEMAEKMSDTDRTPSSVYSSELDYSHWPSPHDDEQRLLGRHDGNGTSIERPDEAAPSRRSSSNYSTDFDSPQSPESGELERWGSEVCDVNQNNMRSLREKPHNRASSCARNVVADWSPSDCGSDLVRSLNQGSIHSRDTSASSYKSFAKSSYATAHSRTFSDDSTASSKQVRFEETATVSFFDFSDDESEDSDGSDRLSARFGSPANKCIQAGRQLRKKALSFRISTTKANLKTASVPSRDVPALAAWLFRPSLLDRVSTSPVSDGTGLEGRLMAGAAENARARRVSGRTQA